MRSLCRDQCNGRLAKGSVLAAEESVVIDKTPKIVRVGTDV